MSLVVLGAGARLRRDAETPGPLGHVDDGLQGCRKGVGIAGGDEDASLTVTHCVGNTADSRRNHGPRGRHRLENGIGKGLRHRGEHGDVEQVVEVK